MTKMIKNTSKKFVPFAAALIIMVMVGCIGPGDPLPADDDNVDAGLPDDVDATPPDACPTPPTPTLSVHATPSTIVVGGSSTLSWVSANTNSCSGSWTSQALSLNGTVQVSPTSTTTYTVGCHGPGGYVESYASVIVNSAPPVPTMTFTANPATITVGQSSTLSWTSTGADHCYVGGAPGQDVPSGTAVVSPTTTTTYEAGCTGPGGTVTKQVTVTVNPASAPTCHGLYVTFSVESKLDIDHCSGWTSTGGEVSLTIGLQVNGGDGICAITCPSKTHNGNVLPSTVSGVWLPGATADVQRWTTAGCRRLPDHPATEANQAGGTWDGRCDLY